MMRTADLLDRFYDRPFKPFRIHLTDGTVYDVLEPGMVIVGPSSAVLPTAWGRDEEGRPFAKRWQTIALVHMIRFSDIDDRGNGKRRKRS